MRVQTKLILSIFPILFGGFLFLSLLSFHTAKNMMLADAYRYVDATLEARIDRTFARRAELLRASKMDKVSSFVELYQQEALDDLKIGFDSHQGCFAVFSDTGSQVFSTPSCISEELLPRFRVIVLEAVADPAHRSRGLVDHEEPCVVGARHFGPWNWVLVYSVETNSLDQAANQILAMTFGVASLCILACGLVIVLAFRRVFGDPVLRLKTAAARIANREPNVAIEVSSKDELGDLSVSLNEMAAAISSYIRRQEALQEELERSNGAMTLEIEQRRLAQAELKDANDKLAITLAEQMLTQEEKVRLEAQLGQARKMESVGRLAGGVAHDFNNMLGVILGRAELALMEPNLTAELRGSFHEIQEAAERSVTLVRQLITFSRQQIIAPKVLDLNDTISDTLKLLRRLISENVVLVWAPTANLGFVEMDPSQIDQILTNLCVNARDAIRDVGTITIETKNLRWDESDVAAEPGRLTGEYVQLSISDNGHGMDIETQAHIFEPFFTTKEVGEGTGLGLATVYGIVKQNHGFIEVASEPGQGTTFRIQLPRYLGSTGVEQAKPGERGALRGHEKILLVEDDPLLLSLITKMLETLGYAVLPASGADMAFRVAEAHAGEIQLLVTDVVMPEMNGKDLAEKLTLRYPELKCLFVSGYSANYIASQGVLEKGVHFIQKPFSIQTLDAKLRVVLDSR